MLSFQTPSTLKEKNIGMKVGSKQHRSYNERVKTQLNNFMESGQTKKPRPMKNIELQSSGSFLLDESSTLNGQY